MIESTRRGFLGLLAHLPLVGAVFASVPRKPVSDAVHERLMLLEDEALRKAKAEVRFIRWIPVTERLPELGLVVLTVLRDGTVHPTIRGADHWGDLRVYWYALGPDADVTHWAELPSAPSEVPA